MVDSLNHELHAGTVSAGWRHVECVTRHAYSLAIYAVGAAVCGCGLLEAARAGDAQHSDPGSDGGNAVCVAAANRRLVVLERLKEFKGDGGQARYKVRDPVAGAFTPAARGLAVVSRRAVV